MLYNEPYAMSYLIHLKHPIADGLAYEIQSTELLKLKLTFINTKIPIPHELGTTKSRTHTRVLAWKISLRVRFRPNPRGPRSEIIGL